MQTSSWSQQGPEAERPVDPEAAVPARVLVVEDEHLVALDIQRRLERMGHVALVAYSGEDAIARIPMTHFDLVLMDIKLKGAVDGVDAARAIRAVQDIPIVYVTAYADNVTLERARETEPYGYLLKPFQERELKAVIEMALQRHGSDVRRREQEETQRFLADATATMAATLDYRTVARGAAELLVPRYADWCTIHLHELDDSIPRFTFTCPDGEGESPTNGHSAQLLEAVLDSGKPELVVELRDAQTLAAELGAEHLDELRRLDARSVICVPLLARGQVLGALALACGPRRAPYTRADLRFVADFGQRLGMALDNALLYRKAERAIHMRDDVLAIVSHDLRSPLGTVLMQAELLVQVPEAQKAAEAIARSAERMNRLIGDLLDATAVNAGQVALDIKVHLLDDVIGEAIEMFRSQAECREISLGERVPSEPLSIRCDRDRIIQVLSNLIDNAVKFTPRGGRVLVEAERAPDGVRIEVHDTGRGIPAEQLPHLFDRFWRGQGRRNGAGLGLFIARGIVAAHGSELKVETAVGSGSRFFFALPET